MRNKRLDILRCVAVITVILHHSGESKFSTRASNIVAVAPEVGIRHAK